MGRKRPTNKLTIQKVWVENDPGSTKRGSNIEVRRRIRSLKKYEVTLPLLLQRGNRHFKQMAFTFFLLSSIVLRLDIESNKRLG